MSLDILKHVLLDRNLLIVRFSDSEYIFHSQWLFDARNDISSSRNASSAFAQNPPTATILSVQIEYIYPGQAINVSWNDGTTTRFPGLWLRSFAPRVAKLVSLQKEKRAPKAPTGWLLSTLKLPTIEYNLLCGDNPLPPNEHLRILDLLLHSTSQGIIKISRTPAPNHLRESNKSANIVTKVLKALFGTVFQHSRRQTDQTFNIASHHPSDAARGKELPNYNTDEVLLPHTDHAHYSSPARIQGWYILEGTSISTFASSPAVLATLKAEAPELYPYLLSAPATLGRSAHFYTPPLYQQTVAPAVTLDAGTDDLKSIRWHPHLIGSILAPFEDFDAARAAYVKFQEIARRPDHQWTVELGPGELLIWDNWRTLHGRERVIRTPRTGIGQTVGEQDVVDVYRALQVERLVEVGVDEKWLVHVPMRELENMRELVGERGRGEARLSVL